MAKTAFPFRMMDANINRVAEGLRVVEDIMRFDREDRQSCMLARDLRHQVRSAFTTLYPQLLAGRNVATDPGIKVSQEQELDSKLSRSDLLLANLKRVQEGLRVLEESAHLLGERALAKKIEGLRFAAYSLESLIAPYLNGWSGKGEEISRGGSRTKLPKGIYALTSEPHSLGRSNVEVARQILKAGVKILQYREKTKKQGEMYRECLELRRMTREAGALFIVNDHLELAVAVGADGVHVGQDDLPLSVVRKLVGPSLIIGVSTHSPEQARAAVAGGADYIGVGPIFATQTKTDVCAPVGLDYLRYVAANVDIPFVAIGGIKEHNLAEVVRAGASTVALVTEIVGSPNIAEKIDKLQEILANHNS
ncbi:MAG TPA: thiamine phosphate synthase [Desulfobacteria bacterium]|nr:thiamine phosphate synthase [Desulfobacteria bacterium]